MANPFEPISRKIWDFFGGEGSYDEAGRRADEINRKVYGDKFVDGVNAFTSSVDAFPQDVKNAWDSINSGVDNLVTGDRDYQRSIEQADRLNEFSAEEAKKARDFTQSERIAAQLYNTAEAEKNRRWQTYMSNTAFQRQVRDLKNAGYNPLGLIGGSGASVGSSTTAHSSAVAGYGASATSAPMYNSATALGQTLTNLTNSAVQLARIGSYNSAIKNVSDKAAAKTLATLVRKLR